MTIPPLANGMPRVYWNEASGVKVRFSAIITEDAPLYLMAGDSGLELVFEPTAGPDGFLRGACIIRAKRIAPAPTITVTEAP